MAITGSWMSLLDIYNVYISSPSTLSELCLNVYSMSAKQKAFSNSKAQKSALIVVLKPVIFVRKLSLNIDLFIGQYSTRRKPLVHQKGLINIHTRFVLFPVLFSISAMAGILIT